MKNPWRILHRTARRLSASRTKAMPRCCPRGGTRARWRRLTRAPLRKSGASHDSALQRRGCRAVCWKGGRVIGVECTFVSCFVYECCTQVRRAKQSLSWWSSFALCLAAGPLLRNAQEARNRYVRRCTSATTSVQRYCGTDGNVMVSTVACVLQYLQRNNQHSTRSVGAIPSADCINL